ERVLDSRAAARETLDFALPPSLLALEPGDLVSIAGLAEGPFEIAEIRDGLSRQIKARTLPNNTAVATAVDRPMAPGGGEFAEVLPLVALAHLPPLPDDPGRSRLVVAGYAQPWPGHLRVTDETTGTAVVDLTRRAAIGETLAAFGAGPLGIWDLGNVVEVSLLTGHLAAADELAVLAGSNRIAVESGGNWEVIGFEVAELVAPGQFRLSRLLRGLEGTQPMAVAAGSRVIVLDGRAAVLPVETHLLGEERVFRVYAGGSDVTGTVWPVSTGVAPALPLPPAQLRARRGSGGDVTLSWVRRSRADGDGWGAVEAPLEHQPEGYRIAILIGSTLVRTLSSATPTVSYGAAEQMADFGALPAGFGFSVAQVSPVLGVGHVATGEFHG
ncbi:MAG TPA: phage tail protein, partial [Devosia sp.]|nr:phage tail protein [Devosia sp.]